MRTVFRDELLNLFPKDERAQRLVAADISAERVSGEKGTALSIAETGAQSSGPRTLSPQIGDENDRRRSRPAENGNRFLISRARLLRHGRSLWLRNRQIRSLSRDRRTGTSARGSKSIARLSDHRRRLQLPRADRAMYKSPRPPSGRSYSNGGEGRIVGARCTLSRTPPNRKTSTPITTFHAARRPGLGRSRRRRSRIMGARSTRSLTTTASNGGRASRPARRPSSIRAKPLLANLLPGCLARLPRFWENINSYKDSFSPRPFTRRFKP